MREDIFDYYNGFIQVTVSIIDEDCQIEAFGERGRMMCLRLSKDNAISMARTIIDKMEDDKK